jgi:hypothetical protein
MLLPRSLTNDPEIARTMLGISSPTREVTKLLEDLLLAGVKKKANGDE